MIVELTITDTSTATVNGQSVTGPLHCYASEVVAGGTTYSEGYILVSGGVSVKTLDHTHTQIELLPFLICILIIQGISWATSLARSLF